jgi:hypothetical protein
MTIEAKPSSLSLRAEVFEAITNALRDEMSRLSDSHLAAFTEQRMSKETAWVQEIAWSEIRTREEARERRAQMREVYIVTGGNFGDDDPAAFENEEDAKTYARLVGGCMSGRMLVCDRETAAEMIRQERAEDEDPGADLD